MRVVPAAAVLAALTISAARAQEPAPTRDPDVRRAVVLLQSERASDRTAGAEALGDLGALAAVASEALADALTDEVASVRREAAVALSRSGTRDQALALRLAAAFDPDAHQRTRHGIATTYLRLSHGPDALPVIRRMEAGVNAHSGYRDWAVLARWCASSVIDEDLRAAAAYLTTDGVDAPLRARAMRLYLRTAAAPDAPVADVLGSGWSGREGPRRRWLRAVPPGERAFDAVVEVLRGERQASLDDVWLLVERFPPGLRDELVTHAIDVLDADIPGAPTARGRSVAMFPMRDDKRIVCGLIERLGPAAHRAAPALLRELTHRHLLGARVDAARALAVVGTHLVPEIVARLELPSSRSFAAGGADMTTMDALCHTLGLMRESAGPAMPALARLARDGDARAVAALAAMGRAAQGFTLDVAALLDRGPGVLDPDLRALVLHALGRMGAYRMRERIASFLEADAERVRCAAAVALLRLVDAPHRGVVQPEWTRALEVLREPVTSSDPDRALLALGEMRGLDSRHESVVPVVAQAMSADDQSVRSLATHIVRTVLTTPYDYR